MHKPLCRVQPWYSKKQKELVARGVSESMWSHAISQNLHGVFFPAGSVIESKSDFWKTSSLKNKTCSLISLTQMYRWKTAPRVRVQPLVVDEVWLTPWWSTPRFFHWQPLLLRSTCSLKGSCPKKILLFCKSCLHPDLWLKEVMKA